MNSWNPWKMTAIAMGLVMVTALLTGIVVANLTGHRAPERAAEAPTPAAVKAETPRPEAARSETPKRVAAARSTAPKTRAPEVPSQVAVDTCNRQAAQQVGAHDKTLEIVKDAAVGAVVGAAVGAAGGAIAGGGKGAGKGAAIGGVVGAGGGTLYGLNESKKHDERYRESYASCMRSRGYAG